MTDTAADKPVFSSDMPEYKQARERLSALRKHSKHFHNIVRELGKENDLLVTEAALTSLQLPKSQINLMLDQRSIELREQEEEYATRIKVAGAALSIAVGTAAGALAGNRWGAVKGWIAGIGSMLVTGALWFTAVTKALVKPNEKKAAFDANYQALAKQEEEIKQKVAGVDDQFMHDLTERMLSEQKMLEGEGTEAKLVSKAPERTESQEKNASMTGKYAIAPAASNTDAVKRSGDSVSPQR